MNGKKLKPDFKKHCLSEQRHTLDCLSKLILFFFLTSTGGFLWEVLLFLVKDGQFHNRGFLYGPWLPVYGTGAILIYLLLQKINNHHIAVFFLSALIGSSLELAIGWFLNTVWGLRYWDYRSYPFNFYGYICLWSALGFGIAGMVWICILSDKIENIWFRVPARLRYKICTLLVLIFTLDCVAALILPNMGRGITFS